MAGTLASIPSITGRVVPSTPLLMAQIQIDAGIGMFAFFIAMPVGHEFFCYPAYLRSNSSDGAGIEIGLRRCGVGEVIKPFARLEDPYWLSRLPIPTSFTAPDHHSLILFTPVTSPFEC